MKFFYLVVFIHFMSFIQADLLKMEATYSETKIDSLYDFVFDSNVAYAKKLEVIKSQSNLSSYTEFYSKLFSLYSKLLEESYKCSNKGGMFFCYCSIAHLYFCSFDRENTEKYLNFANENIENEKNLLNLALFYRIKAQYVQRYMPDRLLEAVDMYQTSLSYYDKLGSKGREDEIAILWNNLSMDALLRNDSAYIHKAIRKLKEMKNCQNAPIVNFYYMNVNSTLHSVYYNILSDEQYLDSTLFYLRKCLDIYDKGQLPQSFNRMCIDLYTIAAETFSMKKNPDNAIIDSLLAIAIENKVDSMGMARVFQTKARTFFNQNMIDSAEVMALKSQTYIESGYKNNDYLFEKRNIDFLRSIYEINGDYKQAIDFYYLWDKKTEEIRANEAKELVLRFEAEIKESELKQLYAEGLYHKNRIKLFILTCVLLCLAIFFILIVLRIKKRNLNSQIALIAAEREETKLMVKLKEEQTIKMQLEKYMALSDFRLKELELIGKTKDLEQLYRDKDQLDQQVEQFRQKVEAFEQSIGNEAQQSMDLQYIIIEDVKRLFSRQLLLEKKYCQKLEQLNRFFVDIINNKSAGGLSVSHLKYCVCFAIGMGTNEMAECFNIEQTSVHMIRYRLKKKFGLGNDDDLNHFLKVQVDETE